LKGGLIYYPGRQKTTTEFKLVMETLLQGIDFNQANGKEKLIFVLRKDKGMGRLMIKVMMKMETTINLDVCGYRL